MLSIMFHNDKENVRTSRGGRGAAFGIGRARCWSVVHTSSSSMVTAMSADSVAVKAAGNCGSIDGLYKIQMTLVSHWDHGRLG